MIIGVLAVQGAFAEHEKILDSLGIPFKELRQKADLEIPYDGFILPGGESTVQSKLLNDLDMAAPLKAQMEAGAAVLATCAGLILLAEKIEGEGGGCLGLIPMAVRRNAYGRQLASFYAEEELKGTGRVPMTFIRAPYVTCVCPKVSVLAKVNGNIVAVQYKKMIALSFHPELDSDLKIHRKFLDLAGGR